MFHRAILGLLFVVLLLTVAADGPAAAQTGTVTVLAKRLLWVDLDHPGFAKGMQFAAIHGDPKVADGSYTIRLRFPDGYILPPHYHPKAVSLTVLSGTFAIGHGATAPAMPWEGVVHEPSDFFHIPATRPHYGQAKGETVLQLHGVGPFGIFLAK